MGKHGGMYGGAVAQGADCLSAGASVLRDVRKALRGADAVVDHIRPHRGDPVLFWDENNWQALCKFCHDSRKQRVEPRRHHWRP